MSGCGKKVEKGWIGLGSNTEAERDKRTNKNCKNKGSRRTRLTSVLQARHRTAFLSCLAARTIWFRLNHPGRYSALKCGPFEQPFALPSYINLPRLPCTCSPWRKWYQTNFFFFLTKIKNSKNSKLPFAVG